MKRITLLLAFFILIPLTSAGTPQMSVEAFNGKACPTESGPYTVDLHNPGPAADSYTLSVDGPWDDSSFLRPQSPVDVEAEATETVFLWIQAPKTASPGDHSFTISATSSNTGEKVVKGDELEVLSCRSVSVEPVKDEKSVCRGNDAVYDIDVTNTGEVEETYKISADAGELSTERLTLGSKEVEQVELTLNSLEEENRDFQVEVDSTSSYASDTAEISFVSEACRNVDVAVAPENVSICNSEDLQLTASVSNEGTIEDTYEVSIGDRDRNVTVPAGNKVSIDESIPASDIEGNIQVSARSQGLESVYDSALSRVEVDRCHDISFDPVTTAPDAGNRTIVEFSLLNNGTKVNNYTMELDGPDWMDVRPVRSELEPGDQESVYVYMAPDFFGDGTYTSALVVSGEGVRKTVDMNVTAENGSVTVDMESTRTPTGAITGSASGVLAVILTALILLFGGYWFLIRKGAVDISATQSRDYHKSADDFLDQNTNTVAKALREDDLSKGFLNILLEEEKQGKARDAVLNQIRNEIDKA